MDYKFSLDVEPNNSNLELSACINFKEFKKDIPRIIAKDKDFIQIIIRAIIASRIIKDEPKDALQFVENNFKIVAETRNGVFDYQRIGSYRDSIVCFSAAFALQKSLTVVFIDLIKEYIPEICPCDKCTEKRKQGSDSPEHVRVAMEDIIKEFKKPGAN